MPLQSSTSSENWSDRKTTPRPSRFAVDSRVTIHLDYTLSVELGELIVKAITDTGDENKALWALAKQLLKEEENNERY
jgi:hypothetical protein